MDEVLVHNANRFDIIDADLGIVGKVSAFQATGELLGDEFKVEFGYIAASSAGSVPFRTILRGFVRLARERGAKTLRIEANFVNLEIEPRIASIIQAIEGTVEKDPDFQTVTYILRLDALISGVG